MKKHTARKIAVWYDMPFTNGSREFIAVKDLNEEIDSIILVASHRKPSVNYKAFEFFVDKLNALKEA